MDEMIQYLKCVSKETQVKEMNIDETESSPNGHTVDSRDVYVEFHKVILPYSVHVSNSPQYKIF